MITLMEAGTGIARGWEKKFAPGTPLREPQQNHHPQPSNRTAAVSKIRSSLQTNRHWGMEGKENRLNTSKMITEEESKSWGAGGSCLFQDTKKRKD